MHIIHEELTLDTTLDQAWDFISYPRNLNKITPDDMGFEILHDIPEEMHNGLLIVYRIQLPLFGKRLWLTELKHIRPRKSFVDEQRIGPYQFWYHYHEVCRVENGVRFTDHVTYQLPFGPLGNWVHSLVVRSQLQEIFDYRKQALQAIFPSSDAEGSTVPQPV